MIGGAMALGAYTGWPGDHGLASHDPELSGVAGGAMLWGMAGLIVTLPAVEILEKIRLKLRRERCRQSFVPN